MFGTISYYLMFALPPFSAAQGPYTGRFPARPSGPSVLRIIPALERAGNQVTLSLQRMDRRSRLVVTEPEAHVLAYLAAHGPSAVAQIRKEFGLKRSTFTCVLDRLVQRKLIVRQTNVADRRSFLIRPTGAGARVGWKFHRYLAAIEASLVRGVSERDIQGFVAVVGAMADHQGKSPGIKPRPRTEGRSKK